MDKARLMKAEAELLLDEARFTLRDRSLDPVEDKVYTDLGLLSGVTVSISTLVCLL